MNAQKLNKAIRNTVAAANACRFIEHSERGYLEARELVLDVSGALAGLLEEEADRLHKKE